MNFRFPPIPLLVLAAAVADVASAANPVYVFSHLAGSPGGGGAADGIGAAARFNGPTGIVVGTDGNLYVADYFNFTVRKVTPGGVVTTFAGAPIRSASQDGIGAAARFSNPMGICADHAGNFYVADQTSETIRKITPAGVVTTLAGSAGQWGDVDATGADARLSSPDSVAVDSLGNLYVADTNNNAIRKITPAGVVTTFAGGHGLFDIGSNDGQGTAARFESPVDTAVDSAGNVYVADEINGTIRKITPAGLVSTLAGLAFAAGSADGVGSAARFGTVRDAGGVNGPEGVAVDSAGNVYVADMMNNTIRKITPAAVVTTLAGTAGQSGSADGMGAAARFNKPSRLTVDSGGNIYVADWGNQLIRKITPAGLVTTIAGRAATSYGAADGVGAAAQFSQPSGVAVDGNGQVYVADTGNATIRKVAPDGTVTTLAGTAGTSGAQDGTGAAAKFNMPGSVAVDGQGNVYVADTSNQTIRKITPAGVVTTFAGSPGLTGGNDGIGGAARFWSPSGVATDAAGNVYVADQANGTIRKITPDGTVTTLAGAAGQRSYADGVGAAARFMNPLAVAVDGAGNVYVADGNYTVRKVTSDGVATTLAGAAGQYGTADGIGAAARFVGPSGIAVDASGTVYVTDSDSFAGVNTIRRITPDGNVTTLAGSTEFGSSDGDNSTVRFSFPKQIAVDAAGVLYVADSGNGAIRKGIPALGGTHFVNISTRAYCSTGNSVTIGGFVVGGNGTKRVLVRAVGPTLTTQGIGTAEVLADPTIEVHHGNSIIATNDNWTDNTNPATITDVSALVGANPLAASDTKSSALLIDLTPGVYSFVVNGKGGSSGIVLIEVYDADLGASTAAFVNISARGYATTGNGVTIGGFVIAGSASKRVLLRGVGPTLTKQGIGQAEVLVDPSIELHSGPSILASNDNVADNANASDILTTGARVGAFPLDAADTTSSALLLTLSPGVYSFIANGKANASGIVLIEVYDAD